jgi:phenylalanyl-tRNA synthetase alpha chain
MADALAEVEQVLQQGEAELASVGSADELEQWRIKYLGSKGRVNHLMDLLAEAPREQKKVLGKPINTAKGRLTAAYEAKKQEVGQGGASQQQMIDVTEPGVQPRIGNRHILMKVTDELVELFGRMGFSVATGPEVEDEFHNFVALNIPESHPARDPLDNFYLERSGANQGGLQLLRTQTSTVQIRVMETTRPPIRVVVPGRVYRPDTVDATHLFMFYQLEALVVDRNVTMVDLKSTIMQFIHAYFGPQTKVRFRPSFFPFTEPSAEVDVWFEDRGKWIELGGCGMVHPNVLTACKIDPEEYSGWAFGFGIERIAMRKYGITDIRHFIENDIRFLKQF